MTRPPADPNVRLLFRSTFLFGLACGISVVLTSLHLTDRHFSEKNIGTLAFFFASGIVLMSLPAGALVRRFSAKRTLVASMLSYAVCVTAFPFLQSYSAIALVRLVDGASSVGIWVASETILLSRTRNEDKAHYTSIYAIWLASGYVLGPLVARGIVLVAERSLSFVVSGVLALACAAVLARKLERDAPEHAAPKSSEGSTADAPSGSDAPASSFAILWRIKCSCFATYAYGYFQTSVVLFLPLYLVKSKGVQGDNTVFFTMLFALGMLISSNPSGRAGDRFGHLSVMRAQAVIGTLMIVGFIYLDSFVLMLIAVFIAGSTLAAMSPVSLALQGVVTEKKNYSRSNAIYNVFYASGMLMGPLVSSAIIDAYDAKMMLRHLAALYVAFIVFTVVFRRDDPAVDRGARAEASAGSA